MLKKLLSKLTGKRIATLREASVRIIDDTKLEINWKTARRRGHLYGLWLIDLDDAVQDMVDSLADSTDVKTFKYEEWQKSGSYGYEVDVIEHCFNCEPSFEVEPAPRFASRAEFHAYMGYYR
jgi:hypothetical protein